MPMNRYNRPPENRRYARRYERPQRRGNGCLVLIVVLIWGVLALLIGYQFFFRQQVSRQIGEQISQQLGGGATPAGQPGSPAQQIGEQAAGALPTAIAALPTGELRISDDEANAYLAAHAGSMQPVDSVVVRFLPGEMQADITALGSTSQARAGLALQAGRVIVVDPRIDGPLSNLIEPRDLISPLEQQLNDQLAAQGKRITDVRVEQGELVLLVE